MAQIGDDFRVEASSNHGRIFGTIMTTRAHTVPRFYLGGFTAVESKERRDPFVWLGSLSTGMIERRSPKNISIARGYYDGIGGFVDAEKSIENHLSQIESEAAFAIPRFVASPVAKGASPSSAIWRFLSWQAARTPGWFKLEQEWVNDLMLESDTTESMIEPPPEGLERIADRLPRSYWIEDPHTGQSRELSNLDELRAYRKRGWKWILSTDDRLELLHMQAWYFQARHFPRLSWTRLDTPDEEHFITSDRGVAWLVDGFADTPPAGLRDQTAQVVAPLTRKTALVGRYGTSKLRVTPREVNRFIAFAASDWIIGPTRDVVELAIQDRNAGPTH